MGLWRLIGVVLMGLTGLVASAQAQGWPKYGVMTLEDHKAYFTEGAFASYSPEFEQYGREILIEADYDETGTKALLNATWAGVFVYSNLLPDTDYEFAKTRIENFQRSVFWNAQRKSWIVDIEPQDVSDVGGEVWLSHDNDLAISPDDKQYGTESSYYDEAYALTGGACCLSQEEYDAVTIGRTVETCSFINHQAWDVVCYYNHQKSGNRYRYYYKRMHSGIS